MFLKRYLKYYVTFYIIYKGASDTCVSNFTGHHGMLETWVGTSNISRATINCTWTITPPPQTITMINMERIITGNCSNHLCNTETNLIVSGRDVIYRNHCCSETKLDRFSIRGSQVSISLSTPTNIKYRLYYSFRNSTICENHDFQCTDKDGCYNNTDICDGKFSCRDHSDEVGCRGCAPGYAPCNFQKKHCFDPAKERCNGVFNCPNGEDEGNCSIYCVNAFNCFNSTDCFHLEQRCDGDFNCPNGFDELKCFDDIRTNQDTEISLIIVFGIVLCTAFVYLIWRWFLTRRNIDDLMNNMPQMPLPPFRGPGDRDDCVIYNIQYSESDYMHGGEIYEAYVRARRRMSQNRTRRSQNIREVQRSATPPSHYFEYDTECAAVALASLGISPQVCIGLNNVEDQIKTLGDVPLDWKTSEQETNEQQSKSEGSGGNSHMEDITIDVEDRMKIQ